MIPVACVIIGATTASLSSLGVMAGRRVGARVGKRAETFGGALLVGLGVKILIDRVGLL